MKPFGSLTATLEEAGAYVAPKTKYNRIGNSRFYYNVPYILNDEIPAELQQYADELETTENTVVFDMLRKEQNNNPIIRIGSKKRFLGHLPYRIVHSVESAEEYFRDWLEKNVNKINLSELSKMIKHQQELLDEAHLNLRSLHLIQGECLYKKPSDNFYLSHGVKFFY